MYRFVFTALLVVLFAASALTLPVQDEGQWDVLTVQEMGVDRFRADYPDFNGKGVVVAVLDTGVDMGVDGLKTLPDGEVKVVDCRDFTGEGDHFWEEGDMVPDGKNGFKLVDSEGREFKNFEKLAICAEPERYYMTFIEESRFSDTSVKDLNSDGDSNDTFGVLIFTAREECKCAEEGVGEDEGECEHAEEGECEHEGEGKHEDEGEGEEEHECECAEKGDLIYYAVVDINGDGNLEDGVCLTDYWRKHQTFVLKGKKGARKMLTMALNFYPEEKRLSIHFDDGGHGTHVAGIAAGYSIHGQEGYNGLAPGARVISLKIGNNRYAGGSTVTESVKKALDYGVKYSKDNKVPVVFNMSFGIGSEREGDSAIDKYVDDILWKNPGVVFVTSAGNEGPGLSSVGTPAASVRAISVGAMLCPAAAAAQYACNIDREVAFSFSSRGGDTFKPDIMAPGSAASTVPLWGGGDHMNGTSMASPAAAGAIALVVDGLVRHDPPFTIDNALIHRAVKNTGRDMEGLSVLDEGGGAIDVPAAYDHALFLCETEEAKKLREYRINNNGPAPGKGVSYWRISPCIPRKTEVMGFSVSAGFPAKMTDEDKARFYRAFDLKPDVEWLSLTKPMAYLKGSLSASVGIMADIAGKAPGLYTGKVTATRKSNDTINGAPVHEFDIVVSVLVPHRVNTENRGRIKTVGELEPGCLDRVFVEAPYGTTSITTELRMIDGNKASSISAAIHDPEGVGRGGVRPVSERGSTEAKGTIRGTYVVPGTWEIVVNSSIRSRAKAKYDLRVTFSGAEIGEPIAFAEESDLTKQRILVPVRCTQALPLDGTVSGRIDGFVKKEVITVKDTDKFTRTVRLDNTAARASWTLDFDRDTYALFTDCVFRIEDPETDKVIRNSGLGQRSGAVSLNISSNQAEPKEYRIVVLPGFSLKKDLKRWRFTLTEKLTWKSGALNLEAVAPKGGKINIMPGGWADVEFRMPGTLPAVPEGYALHGVLDVTGKDGLILRKDVEM